MDSYKNGKNLRFQKQDGFMKVDVKAGEGKVTLTYIPNGFKEGAYLSILGIILFLAYTAWKKVSFKG